MSATALWTVAEVARALGLPGQYPDTPIDFVTQDSRLVKPGSLFVALSGTPIARKCPDPTPLKLADASRVPSFARKPSTFTV